ncbi:hypothetical protein H8356DRAFT_1312974 [Neocallimastix lanati (nom. inval.)]|nr:hypothetical protein H8356DRAFT_1312974 [Neocallimastix sp. JGI-2020a]
MNIESFIKIFLFDLKNQDKNCINEINENKNMIKLYLSENGNPKVINSFIERFNNIVLIQNDTNDFKLIKKVLTHKSFTYIYSLFKNSNILIQAYNTDKKCLNLTNNDGNNALFFSINNENAFKELLKSKIDVNHINKRNESIFLYCCKNKAYNILSYLFDKKSVDLLNNKNGENKNIDQNENINALMKYRKEIDEYLYPCIHDNYSEFKMSDNLAKTLKDTYENNVQ